ncbi:ChrR family anti-sigma-E factor [Lysobacter niabensis]|uniref:ChrR family anti-sigma-E factor n=1 Tax=Agrilutibacter niabensis TaxID=380628 RepID=UPI00360C04BE
MKPHHHIDVSTLIGYSAGALPQGFAAVVASHLQICAICRSQLRNANQIGGQLLRQQEGQPLAADARDRMLERVIGEQQVGDDSASPPGSRHPDALPLPLQPYFGTRYSDLRWRMLAPGVHHIRAVGVDDSHLMLLRTAPGKSIPLHTHGSNELTMILRGAYDDCLGHFAPGDVADLDNEIEHQPVTAPGAPCVCVAATDAPLRFSGWLARTLQPLFGL